MPATTTLLGLVTPTQGTLSGTWGDTVNYGISDYVDIAIAGTLSFAGDGAITLANTTGSSAGNAIVSTTAQYMVIRITGTQTVTKVITGPSYSKLYMVDHAGATSAVTFKAAGQTGVSVAVGEKCFVYYNGTDYVKVASSVADGVTTIDFGSTGLTPNTATSGAVTVAGTLAIANGGTNSTATATAGGVGYGTGTAHAYTAASTGGYILTSGGASAPAFIQTLPVANGGTNSTATATAGGVTYGTGTAYAVTAASTGGYILTSGGAGAPAFIQTLPAANGGTGVANNAASTLTISGAFATTLTVSGTTGVTLPTTGTLATLAGTETLTNKTLTSPTLTTPQLGTPSQGVLSSCTVDGTNKVGYLNIPQSGSAKTTSYTLVVGDVGKFVVLGTSGLVVVPASIFAVGDAISVANNTAAAITCTSSAVTAYLGGTNTIVTSFSLASRGVCTILYVTASVVFITGNVS